MASGQVLDVAVRRHVFNSERDWARRRLVRLIAGDPVRLAVSLGCGPFR